MPQPFKRRGKPVSVSPASVVWRPALAIDIALIASHWTKIEQTLSIMYTYLLFGQEPGAFEFYHKLVSLELKKDAFMSAATGRLPQDLIDEVTALFSEIRKFSPKRNDIIHGTWATSDQKPDSLLLSRPKDMNEKLNELFRGLLKIHRSGPAKESRKFSVDLTPDEFTEYNHEDFQWITKRLIEIDEKATLISNKVFTHALEHALKPPERYED
jgi:hypothetical protein